AGARSLAEGVTGPGRPSRTPAGFVGARTGYQACVMSAGTTSEVRLPADPSYIVVAKRAAAGFACVAGFDVEAVDDLVIAVAQATENAIEAAVRNSGRGGGQVRLSFRLEERRLEIQVRSLCGRGEEAGECAEQP